MNRFESNDRETISEVLHHDFTHEDTHTLREDFHSLTEDREKILEVRKQIQNSLEAFTDFNLNAVPDDMMKFYHAPLEDYDAKLQEARAELERRSPVLRLWHKVQNVFHKRA